MAAEVLADSMSDIADTASQFSSTAPSVGAPASHLYTCLACHVAFRSAEHQREHYRSDWHRYNLKRKVADLPPVTPEVFVQRVNAQQAKLLVDNEKGNFVAECEACGKTYSSENAHSNHLQSKKHKEAAAKYELKKAEAALQADDAGGAEKDEDETMGTGSAATQASVSFKRQLANAHTAEEIDALVEKHRATAVKLEETDCIFCPARLPTFEANMEHMAKQHSFFVPDVDYLLSARGLLQYLQAKVTVFQQCVYCGEKGRTMYSVEAVRKHMVDKGHCKVNDESDEGVVEFYDFSSSWTEFETRLKKGGGGAEEWEDVEDDGVEGDEVMEDVDDENMETALARITDHMYTTDDGTQLVLPSGARIGHRAYRRYWTQHLKEQDASRTVGAIRRQYRALGYAPTAGEVVRTQEKKAQAILQMQSSYQQRTRAGYAQNNLRMKYLRRQVPI
ncbi:C2H2 type zinc-finger-domain-containing protein [Cladochytrium replicatum]|nr:C2H2 type zinc-finger-domain-containing protein [Cladochytrium replicatum]